MDGLLQDIEIRILGCLIEKEFTTPDYYPLTLNALINACNQKSNRNPVVSYDEETVARGLDELRKKGFVEKMIKADSRVPKYKHLVLQKLNINRCQAAILCELLLRGPQTGGEIRSRAERMYSFRDLHEVEDVLNELIQLDQPMVMKLPRQTGQKERRFMHLFGGEPEQLLSEEAYSQKAVPRKFSDRDERISKLEEDVRQLQSDVNTLKKDLADLRAQFE